MNLPLILTGMNVYIAILLKCGTAKEKQFFKLIDNLTNDMKR